jgi:hypothetical protein
MSAIQMQAIANSSLLDSVGHDAESQTMQIRFKARGDTRGALFRYSNVSGEDFAALVGAESVGSHFQRNIKAAPEKYPFERVVEPD